MPDTHLKINRSKLNSQISNSPLSKPLPSPLLQQMAMVFQAPETKKLEVILDSYLFLVFHSQEVRKSCLLNFPISSESDPLSPRHSSDSVWAIISPACTSAMLSSRLSYFHAELSAVSLSKSLCGN